MCRPRYLYRVKLVDVRALPEYSHEEFTLGDMVDIIDPDVAPDSPRPRIIRHKYNIFQPWECELDIGDPEERLIEQLKASFNTTKFVGGKFNSSGRMSGNYLEDLTVDDAKIKSLTANKITAGTIDASKINVININAANITVGKISASQIKTDELVVGDNIRMGPNATISWSNVTDKPSIPVIPSYIKSTYIDETTIMSPEIYGGYIYGGIIEGGQIISNSEIDVNTDVNIGRNLFMNATTFNQGIYFNTFNETSLTVLDPVSGILVRGGLVVSGAATGYFNTADGKTVQVRGGIVVAIN